MQTETVNRDAMKNPSNLDHPDVRGPTRYVFGTRSVIKSSIQQKKPYIPLTPPAETPASCSVTAGAQAGSRAGLGDIPKNRTEKIIT